MASPSTGVEAAQQLVAAGKQRGGRTVRTLAQTAQQIDAQRRAYLDLLRPGLQASTASLLPELGAIELRYRRGWSDERDLAVQLREQRPRDLARGHTTLGAHRADWSIVCMDDLASELDQAHQASVVEQLQAAATQVLLTGTELPSMLQGQAARVFHVEQGELTRLL